MPSFRLPVADLHPAVGDVSTLLLSELTNVLELPSEDSFATKLKESVDAILDSGAWASSQCRGELGRQHHNLPRPRPRPRPRRE
jgi:hypothetical protein